MDPIKLEDLLQVWEEQVAPLRRDLGRALDNPELDAHLHRATVFLDRYDAATDAQDRSVLADIPRSAAFLSDGSAKITDCNRPGAVAFGISKGGPFVDLPFEPEDRALLQGVIRKVAGGRAEQRVTLRIRSSITGSPVILRVSPVVSKAQSLALVVSTELVWPLGFELIVQEAFGLTPAEVEIVRGITLGLPIKDIAEARGRSAETVRTQVRSILQKTETHSQSELVRVVLGLMDVAAMPSEAPSRSVPRGGALEPRDVRELWLADGRRLTWIEFGDPKGQPILFMHMDYGLIRWPASAERHARARKLRVIVPVRAGYGLTDLHLRAADHLGAVSQDYIAVLDHLAVQGAIALPMGADLRFAMNLSLRRPDLISGIVGAACQLPLRHAAQYERMDKWQRFILSNARYAPKVLPFLVQAGFSLARRLGKDVFFAQVNGNSRADIETFDRPEVREAILIGSDVCLSRERSAHEAFARECIGSEKDWSDVVRRCIVPVVLLLGDQDPQTPMETMRELAMDYPQLTMRFLPETGQLLFFKEWPLVLEEVELMIARLP
ncbi:LuxR C-terminal-related transcriptional regulator [Xinfangfangia sp. CPCC 101601]|uniref:LuxR C-terminal-related transcriptional regulator n=1 Tax=Pseudogemmobacter lacusdianii TaxID=3069608 RepID=A0ABU0VTB1_9RHOB|nr:LuxR C-terminal-related transcriptional regulator [Xinfangfangia sp. CPCC 101601]MDQ2064970.1 LuxR C-terminal-related transcriptional regulator [Xinfangfangia sp. CPCC 101601]